jgi:acyl-homoserine lactone acylase PvdQ
VQAFLEAHPERSPDLRPPLEPVLAVAMHRLAMFPYYVLDGLSVCLNAGVDVDEEVSELATILKARRQSVGASNEWVLMPSRTADGVLMLLSDPHGSLDGLPMSEVEVEAGDLKYIGYHVIGAALPMLGHTRHVAWGCTTGNPSVSDCYAVEVSPDDPLAYSYDGEPRRIRRDTVTVQVRDRDEPVVREVEYTEHNGVLSQVVAREGTTAYVVSSPYMHVPHLLEEQAYAHLHAASVDEVYEALRPMGWFPQNLLYGDSSGNALYVRNGRTPIRPDGVDITKPLDGNTSTTVWLGVHPVEDLVQVRNPACGYAQNNNVSPDRMLADTSGTTLEATRYPAYVYGDRPGRSNTRGVRAIELLSQSVAASVEDAVAIAVDDLMPGIEAWQAALATALAAQEGRRAALAPRTRAFAHRLLAHDGRARGDSAAALGYWYWRRLMLDLPGGSDEMFAKVEQGQALAAAEQQVLVDALDAAVSFLEREHGSVDTPMGEVFRIGRGGTSFPGRCATIPSRRRPDPDYPFDSLVMPLHLMIYSEPDENGSRWAMQGSHTQRLTVFGTPVRSYALLNYGQSGVPSSAHFVDQARLFSEGRLRPTYFESQDLAAHVASRVELRTEES